MKKITFLTFIFTVAVLFIGNTRTAKAATCSCANKVWLVSYTKIGNDTDRPNEGACNLECASRQAEYYGYSTDSTSSSNWKNVQKTATDLNKGCCRFKSIGGGQWSINSNYSLDGCKTYGTMSIWEFYPGDITSDCSNPFGVTDVTGAPPASPPTPTPTPTPTPSTTPNQNTNCSSITVCSEKNVGEACCGRYTNEINFYEGVCKKVEVSKYDCDESLSAIIKKFPNPSNASMCVPACSGTQNCEKMTSGEWKCVEKAPDNCNGKCTNTQNCEKMTSGEWKCVEKPPVTSNAGTSMTIEFPPTLKYTTVQGFLGSVLDALRQIIVVLSIIFIVIGGIMYIVSIGNEKRMTTAKGAITASIVGLALGIAAPSFLKEIYTILGANSSSGVDTSELVGPTLSAIALRFLDFLLAIVGVLALIMLIIGGMMYLTSAGEEKRIETGRKIITYSIIGIAISLAALVIVKQIANLLK
ncbi:MAG: pilin [bacterium]|nr:pilin [bacterium]